MSGPSDRVHSYRNLLSIAVDEGFLGRRATLAAQMRLLDGSRSNRDIESGPVAETGQGRTGPTALRL